MNHKNAFAISREPWIRVEVFVRIAALGLVLGLGCGDENPAAPVGLGIPGYNQSGNWSKINRFEFDFGSLIP